MAKLEITYAWSNSRIKILRECKYRYYLTYFCAWEGWLTSASQEKQKAYLLKQITSLPMWAGSIVHDVIEKIITTARKTGDWGNIEKAQQDGIQALRNGWKESIDKKWQTSPKKINLSEHFYQEEISPDKLQYYKQKVLICLKAFYDMPLFDIMRNLKKEDWLTIEDFAKFSLNTGETVAVKIDAGFRHDGKLYLLDWKTGKVSDSVIEQLVTYSMYSLKQEWTKKPGDIIVIPVYLAEFAELGEQAMPHLDVTMQHMKKQASIIRSEYQLLTKAFENKDNPSYFQKTDDKNICERCNFRDMCTRTKTEVREGDTPF